MQTHLFENYFIEIANDVDAFNAFLSERKAEMYPKTVDLDLMSVLSEKEINDIRLLYIKDLYRLDLYILHNEEKIGWCFGRQSDQETFHMENTAIFEEHRNKGIYKAILPAMLKILKEKGFQKVSGRHGATNNAIIIPKLKVGFVITGFEISDMYGTLVTLTYFFNETRKKVVDFRVGELQPDDMVRKVLGIRS